MGGVTTAPVRTARRTRRLTVVGLLRQVLLAHLLLVFFQIPLRAMVWDTTYMRDVLLIAALAIWGCLAFLPGSKTRIKAFDVLVGLYIAYGLALILVARLSGLELLDAVTQFRNYFLPVALYFPAKRAFANAVARAALINLLLAIGVIYLLDVLVEYALLRSGLPMSTLPWYTYMFRVNDRFIGNAVGAVGYVLPEHTPILGFLGWPHYTAATLMALFAFSYPFLVEKDLSATLGQAIGWVGRLPLAVRQFLGFLVMVALLLLNVKTHFVSAAFVLLVLPFFTQPRLLRYNLLIVLLSALLLLAVGSLRASLGDALQRAFLGAESGPSTLSIILSRNELDYIISSPWPRLLMGSANVASPDLTAAGAFELRLLLFTAAFGLIWLGLYLGLYGQALRLARKLIVQRVWPVQTRLFATGMVGVLAVFMIDMGHYARPMFLPNIDFWAIGLGVIAILPAGHAERDPKRLRPLNMGSRLLEH